MSKNITRTTLCICMLLASKAMAQKGAIELSIGGGLSMCSNPGKNMVYKGDRTVFTNYSGLVNATFNIHRSFSLGLELRTMELSRKSDMVYSTYLKTTIGGDDRKFVYTKRMLSTGVVLNGRVNTNRGYIYGGCVAGYAAARHNSKNINVAKESYRAPDGGNGLMLGVHAGYTHGLNRVIGLNVEGALRNYSLKYEAIAPEIRPYTNLQYNITAYTITVGIKFRITPKYRPQNDIPAMRGGGQSISK